MNCEWLVNKMQVCDEISCAKWHIFLVHSILSFQKKKKKRYMNVNFICLDGAYYLWVLCIWVRLINIPYSFKKKTQNRNRKHDRFSILNKTCTPWVNI